MDSSSNFIPFCSTSPSPLENSIFLFFGLGFFFIITSLIHRRKVAAERLQVAGGFVHCFCFYCFVYIEGFGIFVVCGTLLAVLCSCSWDAFVFLEQMF